MRNPPPLISLTNIFSDCRVIIGQPPLMYNELKFCSSMTSALVLIPLLYDNYLMIIIMPPLPKRYGNYSKGYIAHGILILYIKHPELLH